METIVISGTGLYTPPNIITNEELVASFNEYARNYNQEHEREIAAGTVAALQESNSDFIVKASGIRQRYVVEKSGILNPKIMHPLIAERANTEQSLQCEMAIAAAQEALQNANKKANEIDAVIVACSNLQRPYPAIAIEVQAALGINGHGFDMNVACSSATFALQVAADMVRSKHASCVLTVNPEICSAGLSFRDRDSHFIFGDACTASLVEAQATATGKQVFDIISSKTLTQYSNNIRSNFGYLNSLDLEHEYERDKLFVQNGRQVFREVVPMAAQLINNHLAENNLTAAQIKRFWLHQANLNMNNLIAEKILGRAATAEEAPIILNEYANTASAGSIIAFHKYKQDLVAGDMGLLCSFGAGYSIGSLLLRKSF